jgi:hypothetical protein
MSNKWLAEHIQQGHGPLGAAYPDVAYGMEGDTPSWLGLIPNGLGNLEHPNWGGWGGRYELYKPEVPVTDPRTFIGGVPLDAETRSIWSSAMDEYTPSVRGEYGRPIRTGDKLFRDAKVTIWRWRDDFHPPNVTLPSRAHPDRDCRWTRTCTQPRRARFVALACLRVPVASHFKAFYMEHSVDFHVVISIRRLFSYPVSCLELRQ